MRFFGLEWRSLKSAKDIVVGWFSFSNTQKMMMAAAVILAGAVVLRFAVSSEQTFTQVISDLFSLKQDERGKSRGKSASPVIVATVGAKQDSDVIGAIGDGRSSKYVVLFVEMPGEIVDFPVKSGELVKKGDVILRLDSEKAKLAVQVAQSKLEIAERTMERAQKLRQKNITAKANVDDATNLYDRARIELLQAEEALQDRTLLAPFDGNIGIAKVEVGDRVAANTEIVTLDDRRTIEVQFDVSEQFYSRLTLGQEIQAETPSHEGRVFQGKITQIDSRIDITSRAFKVRAEIANEGDVLRPGMSFSVLVNLKGKTYAFVPELALQWGKGQSYVWRVRNGKAEQVFVRMIKRVSSDILVEGDLSSGEQVVIEGVQRLRDGGDVVFTEPRSEKDLKKPDDLAS